MVCSDKCAQSKRRREWRQLAAQSRNTEQGRAKHLAANRRYLEANRPNVNAYYRDKRKNDPDFKMACAARSMLRKVLKRTNRRKDARCAKILGYDGAMLRAHIERQFTKGMSWERFGTDIHIDHIVPVAELIRQGVTDPSVINALSNLRPMWAEDNLAKSDKVVALL